MSQQEFPDNPLERVNRSNRALISIRKSSNVYDFIHFIVGVFQTLVSIIRALNITLTRSELETHSAIHSVSLIEIETNYFSGGVLPRRNVDSYVDLHNFLESE